MTAKTTAVAHEQGHEQGGGAFSATESMSPPAPAHASDDDDGFPTLGGDSDSDDADDAGDESEARAAHSRPRAPRALFGTQLRET